MVIVGIIIALLLVGLALWQAMSKWRVYQRLEREGSLMQAQVTAIKQEPRLVAQLGSISSTYQKQQYESFLYAQCEDPISQNTYTFRIKIDDNSQFHVGEVIPIRMNKKKPNEYRIVLPKQKRFARKGMKTSHVDPLSYQGYHTSHEERETANEIVLEVHPPKSREADPG
jgi:hypothetical protein